jgi:hypothetical protein
MRLQAITPSHPELVALMRGPRALFATSALEAPLTRAALITARRDARTAELWRVGDVQFRPFTAVGDETYRLYNRITS